MAAVMIAGSWDEKSPVILECARSLGAWIARNGYQLITGGGTGTPYTAAQSCAQEKGVSIGILPCTRASDDDSEANRVHSVKIYTEMGWDGRSNIAVKSADVLVVIGGSNGTLNEITSAYLNRVPVLILAGSSPLLDRLPALLTRNGYIDHRDNVALAFLDDEPSLRAAIMRTLSDVTSHLER